MTRRLACAALLLAGCGRIGFGDAPGGGGGGDGDGGGGGDGQVDAPALVDSQGAGADGKPADSALADAPGSGGAIAPPHCGQSTSAPDPLVISGHVIEFQTLDAITTGVPGATLIAMKDGASVGSATSDGGGAFSAS